MKKVILISFVTVLMVSAAWAQWGPGGQGNCDRMGMMGMGPKDHMGGGHPGCGMQGMQGHGQMGMFGIKMILRHADDINLTDTQRKQLEQLMVDHQLARVEMKARVEKAQIQVRALMRDMDAPENEVMRAIDEVSRARAEMAKQRYRHRQETLSILTDAQIDKLTDLRDEWREERCENRQQMGGKKSFRGYRLGR